jgi:spore maturation protein CgeB
MSDGARVGVEVAVAPPGRLRIVFLGLSITSAWGNGHATTYRALLRALSARGHDLVFLERDVPWYAENRDLPAPRFCRAALYRSLDELDARFAATVRDADVVVVGSYVPDGVAVGDWVLAGARGLTAFYDIDTPVTARKLAAGDREYVAPEQLSRYHLYLSFTGGPLLDELARRWGARPRPLYCAVDPALYHPEPAPPRWDLGYLGTWSADRQPPLERLLVDPARRWPDGRFAVAGAMYPDTIEWPANVERVVHVSPGEHRAFYNAQRFTLNVTRADMAAAGWSPSVRLFEAAACGVPIISDWWPGLDELFAIGGAAPEIFVSRSSDETLALLRGLSDEERRAVAARARRRVLGEHTAAHRAVAFEAYVQAQARAHEIRTRRREREGTWPRSW